MNEEELKAIEQRIKDANNTGGEMWYAEAIGPVVDTDVPALISEARRLRDWQKRAAETLSLAHGIVDDYQLETWKRKDVVPFASLSKQCAQLLSELEGGK